MKLRNKRTGDIWEFDGGFSMKATQETAEKAGAESGSLTCFESSIAELNEEWEDYEEPEEFWYINECGDVLKYKYDGGCSCPIMEAKEIGNYFETEEEAEKAVEKLKAWKRLKDKGFRFTGFSEGKIEFKLDDEYSEFTYNGYDDGCEWYENGEVQDDLDLLFGGEE